RDRGRRRAYGGDRRGARHRARHAQSDGLDQGGAGGRQLGLQAQPVDGGGRRHLEARRAQRSVGVRTCTFVPGVASSVSKNRRAHAWTSLPSTWRRSERIRRRRSSRGSLMAAMIASLTPLRSWGLHRYACRSSVAAPANSLSTSAPSPSVHEATYSLATRFMPSRTGVTSITSAAA